MDIEPSQEKWKISGKMADHRQLVIDYKDGKPIGVPILELLKSYEDPYALAQVILIREDPLPVKALVDILGNEIARVLFDRDINSIQSIFEDLVIFFYRNGVENESVLADRILETSWNEFGMLSWNGKIFTIPPQMEPIYLFLASKGADMSETIDFLDEPVSTFGRSLEEHRQRKISELNDA